MQEVYFLKNHLKSSVSNSEGLHKGYDKFQSLLSQLEIHGAGVSTEDANQKFLRSLPSAWSQVSLIMRTKPGVDSLSFDDMYNNLRVFESDVKGSTASSSNTHTYVDTWGGGWEGVGGEYYNLRARALHTHIIRHMPRYKVALDLQQTLSTSDIEDSPVNDRYAEGMHAVPPPMTGIYIPSGPDKEIDDSQFTYRMSAKDKAGLGYGDQMNKSVLSWIYIPSGPDKEIDDSQFTYGPKQSKPSKSNARNSDFNSYCDFHEKRMAKQAELNNRMSKGSGQREIRPVWNNVQRVNHQNQFVPKAVLTRTGKIQVNTTRTSGTNTVNTARTSGTNTVNTARHSFNRQARPTNAARKVNTIKPIVNNARPKAGFHKTLSPFRKPFNRTTALRTNFSYQKVNTAEVNAVSAVGGKRETAVKPSAGCNWRHKRHYWNKVSKYNGGSSSRNCDYPQRALQNKWIVDSGCSRHMTGNKAYLAEYQDFNGGPVAFGGSKGYITSKDTECLVLSPEFKLPDENQVLLRIPRQNNMYSFNLENIVPSGGLACLIAKATIDESNKWHRRKESSTRPPVRPNRKKFSATQTAPTTTTPTIFGDDETIAQVLIIMSQNKEKLKEKEKGVELKDVEETERPRPTSTRSLLTLKPLPKIDPKDKGKKMIEEEDESDTDSEDITEAKKKFKQLARDEEVARKVQEDWEAEEEVKKLAEEEATKAALSNEYDFIQARLNADKILAEKLQEEEREMYTIKQRAKFLHDTIAAQRRFLAQQRYEAIRNKPPSRNQLRNQMMTYLKHVGGKKHSDLKTKGFEEIKALYDKIKRSDDSFIAIGYAEDKKVIKEMNEQVADDIKREGGGSNRQRRYFSTLMVVLSILDRDDICAIYQLVMNRYQDETPEGFDKILWGDLIIMFNQSGNDEFWNAQQNWKIVSWKLHSSSGIHTIMTDEGIVIHMLVENKYPLKKEVLSQLLKLKLETEEDSTMALELIRFVKKQIAELEPEDSDGDEKDL
ncbi:hypothetical protein Tco_0270961 [Tanacetum coccineum]